MSRRSRAFHAPSSAWQNGIKKLASAAMKNGAKVSIAQGSVVEYSGTAIVNAANEGCIGGGGVDGAVNRKGGEALIEARVALPIVSGGSIRCPTGQSKTTSAGDLECQWVIHAVGAHATRRRSSYVSGVCSHARS